MVTKEEFIRQEALYEEAINAAALKLYKAFTALCCIQQLPTGRVIIAFLRLIKNRSSDYYLNYLVNRA